MHTTGEHLEPTSPVHLEDLPKRGALKRYQLANGPTLAVLRGWGHRFEGESWCKKTK